jgi:membrane protein DedA with SNARE-associated domain/rhodanese-related sulfurtransferase
VEKLLHALDAYGLQIVFVSVFLDQGGLPLPSFSLIIVAAAVATTAGQPLWPILIAAILATLLADLLWFSAGRRYGAAMLRAICRISLSPDSCVGQTQHMYTRYGAPSLIVSKYVPGLAAVATTLAGETGIGIARFALFDGIGATFWVVGGVVLGALFHEAVGAVLEQLELLGNYAIALLLACVAAFVGVKAWQRFRFRMRIRMARITPDELNGLLKTGSNVTILDARTPDRRMYTGWIAGSRSVSDVHLLNLSPHSDVVVYCDCPNDASAALVAKDLQAKGVTRARPLAGGIDAWRARGLPVEGTTS